MTLLSPHFSLDELTFTQVRGIDNTPTPEIIATLRDTAARMEEVRAMLGHPIHVNSGYRSKEVNASVGGQPKSAHLAGHAVDFICPDFGDVLHVCMRIVSSDLAFDQIIEEGGVQNGGRWTHLSFAPPLRRQILTKAPGGGYVVGLPPVTKTA